MFCPKCGKQIQDGSSFCMFCGFKSDLNLNGAAQNTKEIEIVENKRKIVFDLGYDKIEYDEEITKYAYYYGAYWRLMVNTCQRAVDVFEGKETINMNPPDGASLKEKYYARKKGITDKLLVVAEDGINLGIDKAIEYLYQNKVYYSASQFWNAAGIDLNQCLQYFTTRLLEINNEQEKLAVQRADEYNGRPRVIGGGFGFKGAATGIMTAAAINLATDGLFSWFDNIAEDNALQRKQRQLEALENDRKVLEEFVDGITDSIGKIFHTFIKICNQNGIFHADRIINSDEAEAVYENSLKYAKDGNELAVNLIKALALNPYNTDIYEKIIPLVIRRYEKDDIDAFMDFWGTNILYPDYKYERPRSIQFDNCLRENGIVEINSDDTSPSNFYFVIEKLNIYFSKYGNGTIPEYSYYYKSLMRLVKGVENQIDNIQYTTYPLISGNIKLLNYMQLLRIQRKLFEKSYLNHFWIWGDPIISLPRDCVEQILADNTVPILAWGAKEKIGFLTTKYIFYPSKKLKVMLSDIKEITVAKLIGSIRFVYEKKKILEINEKELKYGPELIYIVNVFKTIIVGFVRNDMLWTEDMAFSKPNGSCLVISVSETYDSLVRKTGTIKQKEVLETKVKSEEEFNKEECEQCHRFVKKGVKFCTYCGSPMKESGKKYCSHCNKIIDIKVKFCNYCGGKTE